MSSINVISIDEIENRGLVLIDKNQLLNLLVEVNIKTSVDKRVKWIDRKTAIAKYGVTVDWLQKNELNPNSVLKVMHGKGRTSKKKYNEQSLIDEQNRLAI
ncbi:hypothetical protein OD91_0882 [Lutibacter sp. Hel_I_33_5]|uniref:hypothetical protein n=1 Tax=Lutibacter sp. Hel_I_33_5 TaxID=1566289 RepID=UPI0011A895C2|nr:hypothetical protein [Lutibacter sp. Hel_I_33_5]TVZ55627.1 hypothetical protein OD91_0882 [Lutibacter sp. Hel_I_33_5]